MLNMFFDFMLLLGSTTWSDVAVSFLINGLVLLYCMLPSTRRTFQTESYVAKKILTAAMRGRDTWAARGAGPYPLVPLVAFVRDWGSARLMRTPERPRPLPPWMG